MHETFFSRLNLINFIYFSMIQFEHVLLCIGTLTVSRQYTFDIIAHSKIQFIYQLKLDLTF